MATVTRVVVPRVALSFGGGTGRMRSCTEAGLETRCRTGVLPH